MALVWLAKCLSQPVSRARGCSLFAARAGAVPNFSDSIWLLDRTPLPRRFPVTTSPCVEFPHLRAFRRINMPVIIVFAGMLWLACVPRAAAQASTQGEWQTLATQMPINPVHAALLHNGNVLIVSGSGNDPSDTNLQAAIFDPATQTVTTQTVAWDMFCSGMVVVPDGRAFVNGGTLQYDPFHGQLRSSVYDPSTGQFTEVQNMAHGRWYPTVTNLANGSLMTFSGLDENGNTNSTVEIYTVGSGWSSAYAAPWTPPLYPRMHLLPSGKVFYSGSTTSSRYFDPSAHTWSSVVATTNYSGTRTYGTSILLPLDPGNSYKPVVMIMGGGSPATNTTELIDLSATSPKWVYGPNMSEARIEMNATILPNGKVIVLGGSVDDEDTSTASYNADLYDPATNTFSSAGQNAYPRLYHSNSLLLPNGTVMFFGGNPARGTYEPHIEIYSPAYLFAGTRPSITSVSSTEIDYGSSFQVQTPDAAAITSVVLLRPGAPTHSFDMEQRLVKLVHTAGSGVLNVTMPSSNSVAPPGYYMLFILNSAGVPSVAQFVQLTSASGDIPPSATITSPSGNATITAGQPVYFSGTGSDPDGTVTTYSWTFPGGSPSSSALATPGNVIYSSPGTFTATLTVTDNAGLTDPNPPSVTITVKSAGDFSLSASPTTLQIPRGSKGTATVSVSALSGFNGTVSLGLSGLPQRTSASWNPSTVSVSGSSQLTISVNKPARTGTYKLTITGTSGNLVHSIPLTFVVQ